MRSRIEIIGSPGAGKSTVYPELRSRLGSEERSALLVDALRAGGADRSVRLLASALPRRVADPRGYDLFFRSRDYPLSYFKFEARYPELHRLIGQFVLQAPVAFARPWRLLQKCAAVHAMHEFLDQSGTVWSHRLLLDEEFVQNLVLILACTEPQDLRSVIDRYLDSCPSPDAVVAITAPAEVCHRRVYERGEVGAWPIIVRSREGREFLEGYQRVLPLVLDGLRAAGVQVIELDTSEDRPIPEAARVVERALGDL